MAKSIYDKKSGKKQFQKSIASWFVLQVFPIFKDHFVISKFYLIFQKNKFYLNFGKIGLVSTFGLCTFWLGLQFDPIAAKPIPTNYCKMTLNAIYTKLIGSLHNTIKIILFQLNIFYSIIVDAWNKCASENRHFYG